MSEQAKGRESSDARVQMLLDRLEIHDLVTRYYCAADQRDFDAFLSCFVPGTLVDYSEVLPVSSAHPVEKVTAVIEAAMAAAFSNTQHFMGNHSVTIDGDVARGETYCLAIHQYIDPSQDQDQRPASALRYIDRFVRGDDGWRIEHRRVTRDVGMFFASRAASVSQVE